MSRSRPLLSYLVISVMVFMIIASVVFVYTSSQLKDRITYRIVQQTELISELLGRASYDLMRSGHSKGEYYMVLGFGQHIGVDAIGIYGPDGNEAFSSIPVPLGFPVMSLNRRVVRSERQAFAQARTGMSPAGLFNWDNNTYSRYVPLRAEGSCLSCHPDRGAVLGVLHIRLSTETDFELLAYVRNLIWTLGIIVLMPVAALLIAGAIIKEKNRLFVKLNESSADLRKTYDDMNETEYYLQMILDNSRVIIVTTDNEGRIVEFNREAENLLEYKKHDVVGKDVLMLYDNPMQRSEIMNKSRQLDGQIWEARNREVRFRSRSGKVYHISLSLSTMVNDEGRIIGTVGAGKDISEQKALQFRLTQSEKLAGIGTLASGIAHEINNPLAGILGMAEAIRDEDDTALIKSYTEDIIRYTTHAKSIVKELSSYSRAANEETHSAISLSSVIGNSVRMAGHSVSFDGIEVSADLRDGCDINANEVEMRQVFVNLIVNAVHAMGAKGALSLKCFVQGEGDGGFVTAVVSDTGHGVSEENLARIFDPFFTTKPVGMGTGLGLYVVYKIVTRHRGTIDVESVPGSGTSFILRFPVADGDTEAYVSTMIGG